jgi:hypothetical protein
MKRVAVLISLISIATLAFATPALAAAPTNDTYLGRTVIGSLPFSDSVDTTEATTDADDAEANTDCGAPATDASVWYEFTAAADANLLVDVSASDYSAGVIVVSGSPGSFVLQNCGPGAVPFFASSGETYAILAFDDQQDGAGNGGTLAISIDVAPPPPTIDITVDPLGTFNKVTGSATITGGLACTGDADFTEVDVQLTQNVGRFSVTGFGSVFDEAPVCDGTARPWSVEVFGSNGKFKGGHAASVAFGLACNVFDCGFAEVDSIVKLR